MLKRIRALFSKKDRAPRPGAPDDAASSAEPAGLERPPVHVGPKVVHRPIAENDLDTDAVKIVRRLTRFDHTAYLVGGCVRDLLLDLKPKDFDVATSATPRQIKRLFRNCRIIGRRFRLAHIYFQNGKIIEVATFRARDGDGRADGGAEDEDLLIRDDNVFGTPEDDALRRDFTINCLFYDVNDQCVIDHADGLGDLRQRFIRTIGDPDVRFREDPIRILRAIKFAARLGFRIESETLRSLRDHRNEIPKAAAPRILEELLRFCRHGAGRRSFELLRDTDTLDSVLPEFAEGYARNGDAWKLMLHLFDELDSHVLEGHEPSMGEILATFSIPLIAETLGWSADGTAHRPRNVNVRDVVDERLQPFAVRLRAARKDQECCRQIVQTLFRMVPHERIRRSTHRSILRRESLPDSLWILHALAQQWGGQFSAAAEHWLAAARRERGAAPARTRSRQAAGEAGSDSRTSRRRRSRGRGRGRGGSGDGGPPRAPEEGRGKSKPPAADLPPVWDDRYFFAALPSVPKIEGDDEPGGDRYGAAALAARVRPSDEDRDEGGAGEDGGAEGDKPRGRSRRRRRGGRGRRKRGGGSSKPDSGESA